MDMLILPRPIKHVRLQLDGTLCFARDQPG